MQKSYSGMLLDLCCCLTHFRHLTDIHSDLLLTDADNMVYMLFLKLVTA